MFANDNFAQHHTRARPALANGAAQRRTLARKLVSGGGMDSHVKMGLIIGAAIIIAVRMWIYFGPFQSCLRTDANARQCALWAGGGR